MPITMKDVARAAGVSVVTVSRAFNNKPDIDNKTKEHILALARDMNYAPNILARSLRAKNTKSIGIVIPDLGDPVFAEILKGCSIMAKEHDYQILLATLSQQGKNSEEEITAIQTLLRKRVSGLLLQPEHEETQYMQVLEKCPVPYVFWNRQPQGIDCCYVSHDHEYGAYITVKHFINNGHTDICFLVRKPQTTSVTARIKGCYKALLEKKIPESAVRIVECGDSAQDACQLTKKLLEKNRPSAILTWDDVMAIGVTKAVMDSNYRIPQDIAIAGYNDIEMASYLSPTLTTVRQNSIKIGKMATELLIKNIEQETIQVKKILIEPELIIRETA